MKSLLDGVACVALVEAPQVRPELLRHSLSPRYRGVNVDYRALCYCNAGVARHLLTYTPSYSTTSPSCAIPEEICDSVAFAKEFLRMFWDDEGSVKAGGVIEGKTRSEGVARRLAALHEEIGVHVSLYRYRRKGDEFCIYVLRSDRGNLGRFRDIGFRHSIVTGGKIHGNEEDRRFR